MIETISGVTTYFSKSVFFFFFENLYGNSEFPGVFCYYLLINIHHHRKPRHGFEQIHYSRHQMNCNILHRLYYYGNIRKINIFISIQIRKRSAFSPEAARAPSHYKDGRSRYGDFHYNDKTVVIPSYHYYDNL